MGMIQEVSAIEERTDSSASMQKSSKGNQDNVLVSRDSQDESVEYESSDDKGESEPDKSVTSITHKSNQVAPGDYSQHESDSSE